MTKILCLPNELLDTESVLKMLTILFPQSVKKVLPGTHSAERQFLVLIFRENNSSSRKRYFADPLIKYLWTHVFIKEAPDVCATYLRLVKSQPEHGTAKLDKFMRDLFGLETTCNFTILPDIARSIADIEVFSRQDECDYLVRNGMHNKKERRKVTEQIDHLKSILEQSTVSASTGECPDNF